MSDLIKSTEKITSEETSLRKELNDIVDQIRQSNMKIESLLRREKSLEGELKIYSEKQVIDKFTKDQTNTITYLNRES